jgi:DNA-binding LacI/PurR family transcriptional regulator
VATTIHDVARMAGVSIKTVSNVLNGYSSIRPATKQRVLEAIESLDWTPNLTARGLRSGRTGLINLIIPDLRNAYFAELSDVLMEAADAQGLSVIVAQTRGQRRRELDLLRGPRAQMVDGILFSPLALGDQDSPLLATVKTPMVLLGERILDGPKDLVTMHNVEGARTATRHLIDQGRRRILAFGSDASLLNGSANLRLIGYRQALEDAGVPYDPALTVDVVSWLRSTGAAAMRGFLERGIAFDGVVGFNDLIALGAMRALQEAGLRVPQDVAVIGFDNIDEAQYSRPSLSSIDPGREEIAEVAIRFLNERIGAADHSIPPREHLAGFCLVQRESTA